MADRCVTRFNWRYRLGMGLLTLGGRVREREVLYHHGRDDVDRLADETGEKARLVVERDGVGITLYQSTGESVDDTRTHAGSVEELYCTGAGKALLATFPADRVEQYLSETTLQAYTEQTITDPEALRDELDVIRSRGFAIDDEERYEGRRCVASAIVSTAGAPSVR